MDTTSDDARWSRARYPTTWLGRLDVFADSNSVRIAILGLILVVVGLGSIKFIHSITQIEESPFRGLKRKTALGRWLVDPLALQRGEDPYGDGHWFPGPPPQLIFLRPFSEIAQWGTPERDGFARAGVVAAAVLWLLLKLVAIGIGWLLLVRSIETTEFKVPNGVLLLTAALSVKPLLDDVQHGNLNTFLFIELVVTWYAYINRRDLLAGSFLALAIVTKVTPALLFIYFLYKRAWHVVASTIITGLLIGVILPSLYFGLETNARLTTRWIDQMILPYTQEGWVTVEAINQSLPGMLMKYAAFPQLVKGGWLELIESSIAEQDRAAYASRGLAKLEQLHDKLNESKLAVRVAEQVHAIAPVELAQPEIIQNTGQLMMARLAAPSQRWLIKGANFAVLIFVVLLCMRLHLPRTDPRSWLEMSLVMVAMALLSERTWKHHLTTLPLVMLPAVSAMMCLHWSTLKRLLLTSSLVLQGLLLVVIGGELALYISVVTFGLLIVLGTNGWMLYNLNKQSKVRSA